MIEDLKKMTCIEEQSEIILEGEYYSNEFKYFEIAIV